MNVDKEKVKFLIGGNKRFQNPYTLPESYYIWGNEDDFTEIYFEKLKYAVENADMLIKSATEKVAYAFEIQFDISFQKLCSQLIFDSFVLVPSENMICACITNEKFMFGHFIDVSWDLDFNLLLSTIC